MPKYQLRVEISLDDFQRKLVEAVEKALKEIGVPWTGELAERVDRGINEVLAEVMMLDATCGLSLFCKEAVVVPAFSEEAEKLREELKRPVR
ncbi:MAG: hypothetical protein V2G48_01385 [bacterium JZ-2024 1]